jgi:hypothetical protein
MSANALSVSKTLYLILALSFACLVSTTSSAADGTESQPVKTTLPADFDASASKYTAHATLMSDDERNGFYLKWGLIFVGGTGAAIALAIWLFTSGGKEESAEASTGTTAPTTASIEKTSPPASSASETGGAQTSPVTEKESPKEPAPARKPSEEKTEKTEPVASQSTTGDEGAGI